MIWSSREGCNQSNGVSTGGSRRGGGRRFQGTGSGCPAVCLPGGEVYFRLGCPWGTDASCHKDVKQPLPAPRLSGRYQPNAGSVLSTKRRVVRGCHLGRAGRGRDPVFLAGRAYQGNQTLFKGNWRRLGFLNKEGIGPVPRGWGRGAARRTQGKTSTPWQRTTRGLEGLLRTSAGLRALGYWPAVWETRRFRGKHLEKRARPW